MSTLRRKLRRDLRRSWRQFAAVTTMVLLGIAFFVGLLGAMDNLRLSIDTPYRDLRFADFTVSFEAAPQDIIHEVESISGVDRVAGRLNVEIPVTFPGKDADMIVGRIVSLPAPERPAVNDVLITEGEYLSDRATDGILVEKNFATHHGLVVGDVVELATPAGLWRGEIVGIAISPEYLWPARDAWQHMPDVLRRWGVLFMAEGTMASVLGLDGLVNEVAVTIQAGADREAVIGDVQTILEPYGISAVVPREEQASEVVLENMVGALDTLSWVFPLFFLVIVALSTYVLLTRLVYSQRHQIGVLLALGFTRRRVLAHYLGFAFLIGLIGSLLGILGGYVLAGPVTDLFAQRVSLPIVYKVPHWDTMALGVALSLAFTACAGLLPAYRASRERPAATMRGEAPRNGAARFRHRTVPQSRSVSRKLPYRNLRRNPLRSAFTVLALSLAGSLLIVPLGFLDTMDAATNTLVRIQNFDLKALLYRPVPYNVTAELAAWDGVAATEPFVTSSAILKGRSETFNVVVYGLKTDSELYRLFSRGGNRVYPTKQGVLLAALYEKKGLQVGDLVSLGPLERRVAGFVSDYYNSAFLPLEEAQDGFLMPGLVNGLFLKLESAGAEDPVRERLYASLPVWAVSSTSKTIQDWNDMLRLFYGFIGVIVVFGLALAAAIVFNAVTINVLERNREIATMRTIGMRGSAIARIITEENLLVLVLSVGLGWILGYILTSYFMTLFAGDLFVLDVRVYLQTFALSATLLLGVLLVSEVPSLRHVQRLDLAKVTKERAG